VGFTHSTETLKYSSSLYKVMPKNVTLSDEAFWKLKEVQVKLRCMSWNELADKIYEMVFGEGDKRDEENEQAQAQTH